MINHHFQESLISRQLLCCGDATDLATWSNIPYFLLQAGRRHGLLQGGLKLDPLRLRRRRQLWNLAQLLRHGRLSGSKYSCPRRSGTCFKFIVLFLMSSLASQLVFGCHSLATLPSKRRSVGLLRRAWELGIRHFDTAPLYSRGYSEILLGQALQEQSDALITSKAGRYPIPRTLLPLSLAMAMNHLRSRRSPLRLSPLPIPTEPESEISRGGPERQLNASLRRLRRSSLNAYLLHELNPYIIPERWVESLLKYQQQGVIGQIGYGGVFCDSLLKSSLSKWLTLLQLPFPAGEPELLAKMLSWLAENPRRELRLFGVFRNGVDRQVIAMTASLLDQYPNFRVLFSCRNLQRLEDNLQQLLG